MNNNDKMLQLVLSDQKMCTKYAYNPNDFNTIRDALRSDNPIVVGVAKIIVKLIFIAGLNAGFSLKLEIINFTTC